MLAHRLDAAAEIDALRADGRVEQLGERGRQRAPLVEHAQDVLARGRDGCARAAGRSRCGSGRAPCRGFDESLRHASPRSRQNASVSSRQTQRSGRTTPSARRTSIPFVVPARREPVEDRLDLVGERVARSRAAGRSGTSSGCRAARPRSRSGPPAWTTSAPKLLGAEARVLVRLGAAQAVVDVQRGDRVAELARGHGRGRSSRRRRRRGRAPRRPARSAAGGGCAPRCGRGAPGRQVCQSARRPVPEPRSELAGEEAQEPQREQQEQTTGARSRRARSGTRAPGACRSTRRARSRPRCRCGRRASRSASSRGGSRQRSRSPREA